MAGTEYNRFLEMHLVGLGAADPNKDQTQLDQEKYDFAGGHNAYWMAYIEKHNNGENSAGTKQFHHVLGKAKENGEFVTKQELEPLRYCACYVSLESLKPGQPILPELASVVEWVSADKGVNGLPIKGKLRINSHGSSADGAKFSMGNSSLSPDDLVDALIRHGLAGKQNDPPNDPPKNFFWKPDKSVLACESCRKSFTFVRRRHHCRKCGGLFCDDCTKGRIMLKNPLTKNGHENGKVEDCRVCNGCVAADLRKHWERDSDRAKGADDHLNRTKATAGLTQITLACCLTARTEQDFGSVLAPFAAKSLAGRFVGRLSSRGIHGIQVAGSYEILAGDDNKLVFGIQFPGNDGRMEMPAGHNSAFDNFRGAISERHCKKIPRSILGFDRALTEGRQYKAINHIKFKPAPGGHGLKVDFYSNEAALVRSVLEKNWTFHSWRRQDLQLAATQSTRLAGLLAEEPRRFMDRAVDVIGGRGPMMTILFTAPQRNLTVYFEKNNDDKYLILEGFETRSFKEYKISAIS